MHHQSVARGQHGNRSMALDQHHLPRLLHLAYSCPLLTEWYQAVPLASPGIYPGLSHTAQVQVGGIPHWRRRLESCNAPRRRCWEEKQMVQRQSGGLAPAGWHRASWPPVAAARGLPCAPPSVGTWPRYLLEYGYRLLNSPRESASKEAGQNSPEGEGRWLGWHAVGPSPRPLPSLRWQGEPSGLHRALSLLAWERLAPGHRKLEASPSRLK